MDRIRQLLSGRTSYEPLEDETDARDIDDGLGDDAVTPAAEFSWVEYTIFLLLGNSMLWAWYVFYPPGLLGAFPFLQHR